MAEALQPAMTVYKSVYVGNIPMHLDEDDLLSFFMQHTDFVHSARIISNSSTDASRGYGFVVVSEDDAEKLIKKSMSANPIVFQGQKLRIKRAVDERPFKLEKFIPTPGYNCYERPKLPEFVSYEENEAGKPTLHCLYDDILLGIFKYLDFKELFGVERVCRRWQFLIYQHYRAMPWCFISDDSDTTDVTYFEKGLFPRLPREDTRGNFTNLLEHFFFGHWTSSFRKKVVNKILLVVGENLPNLSLSQFKGSYLESKALAQLVPNIQTLWLTGTTDLINLSPITEDCKNLTNLFLNKIYINAEIMTAIGKCPKLETLSGSVWSVSLLRFIPKTIKNLQVELMDTALEDIVVNLEHLKDLERLSFFKEKTQSSSQLMLLQTSAKVNFNSKHIKSLAENHTNLQYLRCNTPLEAVDYSALTNLKHLHLSGNCPPSLFDNLPPKLQILCVDPSIYLSHPENSVDLSKLPESVHSLFVGYRYLDMKSLLSLKKVPSVTKLVVIYDHYHHMCNSYIDDLMSLVTIPNLKELLLDHYESIDHEELEIITECRKDSLAKLKLKRDPLLLYGNITCGSQTSNKHVKLLSVSEPMLDGVVFPVEMEKEGDSSVSGFAGLLRDHLFLDDIFHDNGFGDEAHHLRHMMYADMYDDFDYDDDFSDYGGEGLILDDEDFELYL